MAVYTNNTRVAHTAYRMAAHLHEQPRKMRTLSRNVDVDLFIISNTVVKYPQVANLSRGGKRLFCVLAEKMIYNPSRSF